jgi:hypothetical protein
MKCLFSHRRIPCSFAVSLALIVLPSIEAESHCPGSVASVTPRFVQHAIIVIPVRVNQAGPFDFMVDTGSQITIIDPFWPHNSISNLKAGSALFPLPALRRHR